jgi:hypothetical protein
MSNMGNRIRASWTLRKLGLSGSEAVMIGDTPYEPAQDAHQSEYFRNSNCFKQLVFITME